MGNVSSREKICCEVLKNPLYKHMRDPRPQVSRAVSSVKISNDQKSKYAGHHNELSYEGLKNEVFANPEQFLQAMEDPLSREQSLLRIWTKVCNKCKEEKKPGFDIYDVEVEPRTFLTKMPCVLFTMPVPDAKSQAHFVLVVLSPTNYQNLEGLSSKLRYFVLQKGDDDKEKADFCEWNDDRKKFVKLKNKDVKVNAERFISASKTVILEDIYNQEDGKPYIKPPEYKEPEKTVIVTIYQARNLSKAASSFLGFKNSANPYVAIVYGKKKMGETAIIKKSVAPVWGADGETFTLNVGPIRSIAKAKTVECRVFSDNGKNHREAMGTVVLSLPKELDSEVHGWYPLGEGSGYNACGNPVGDLRLALEVREDVTEISKQDSDKKKARLTQLKSRAVGEENKVTPLLEQNEDESQEEEKTADLSPKIKDIAKKTTLIVTIYAGRDLVAQDYATKTSDPYVEIYYGDKKVGKTSVIKKSLNPKWHDGHGETFKLDIGKVGSMLPRPAAVKAIECRIFDYDKMSRADCMGVVHCPPPESFDDFVESWYKVEKGEGQYCCKNASGELKVGLALNTDDRKHMTLKGTVDFKVSPVVRFMKGRKKSEEKTIGVDAEGEQQPTKAKDTSPEVKSKAQRKVAKSSEKKSKTVENKKNEKEVRIDAKSKKQDAFDDKIITPEAKNSSLEVSPSTYGSSPEIHHTNLEIEETDEPETTLIVTIYAGRDLVAQDYATKTSDPYVEIYYGDKKVGKTSVIKKSLNPKWHDGHGETFKLDIGKVGSMLPRSAAVKAIECRIFDYDKMSRADCMGVVHCPPPESFDDFVESWYKVEKGEGQYCCKNASGELKVGLALSTEKKKHMTLKDTVKMTSAMRHDLTEAMKADAKKDSERKTADMDAEGAQQPANIRMSMLTRQEHLTPSEGNENDKNVRLELLEDKTKIAQGDGKKAREITQKKNVGFGEEKMDSDLLNTSVGEDNHAAEDKLTSNAVSQKQEDKGTDSGTKKIGNRRPFFRVEDSVRSFDSEDEPIKISHKKLGLKKTSHTISPTKPIDEDDAPVSITSSVTPPKNRTSKYKALSATKQKALAMPPTDTEQPIAENDTDTIDEQTSEVTASSETQADSIAILTKAEKKKKRKKKKEKKDTSPAKPIDEQNTPVTVTSDATSPTKPSKYEALAEALNAHKADTPTKQSKAENDAVERVAAKAVSKEGAAAEPNRSQKTLIVKIYEGRALVPKDKDMRGNLSSDPYVEIYYGDVKVGKTSIIKKDLNPNWGSETFERDIGEVSSIDDLKPIECRIFDYDMMSRSDCMGVVHCRTPENMFNRLVVGWHKVGKGEGKYYCEDASGKLKIGLELQNTKETRTSKNKTGHESLSITSVLSKSQKKESSETAEQQPNNQTTKESDSSKAIKTPKLFQIGGGRNAAKKALNKLKF